MKIMELIVLLNEESSKELKTELIWLFELFVLSSILLKILFFNEPIISLARITLSLYLLFILPGFLLLNYWQKELSFLERFVVSFAVGTAILSILMYYLGLLGVPLSYLWAIIPTLEIIIGVAVHYKKTK